MYITLAAKAQGIGVSLSLPFTLLNGVRVLQLLEYWRKVGYGERNWRGEGMRGGDEEFFSLSRMSIIREKGREKGQVLNCAIPASTRHRDGSYSTMSAPGSAGDIDVDSIIERLLSVLSQRPGKQVNLEGREIKQLCIKSREIFISQPVLLELEAPIKICGTSTAIEGRKAKEQQLLGSKGRIWR